MNCPMLVVVYAVYRLWNCLPNLLSISHCGHIYVDLARNVARCREGEIVSNVPWSWQMLTLVFTINTMDYSIPLFSVSMSIYCRKHFYFLITVFHEVQAAHNQTKPKGVSTYVQCHKPWQQINIPIVHPVCSWQQCIFCHSLSKKAGHNMKKALFWPLPHSVTNILLRQALSKLEVHDYGLVQSGGH